MWSRRSTPVRVFWAFSGVLLLLLTLWAWFEGQTPKRKVLRIVPGGSVHVSSIPRLGHILEKMAISEGVAVVETVAATHQLTLYLVLKVPKSEIDVFLSAVAVTVDNEDSTGEGLRTATEIYQVVGKKDSVSELAQGEYVSFVGKGIDRDGRPLLLVGVYNDRNSDLVCWVH